MQAVLKPTVMVMAESTPIVLLAGERRSIYLKENEEWLEQRKLVFSVRGSNLGGTNRAIDGPQNLLGT